MLEQPRKPDVPQPPEDADAIDVPPPEVNPAPPPDIAPPVPEPPEPQEDGTEPR